MEGKYKKSISGIVQPVLYAMFFVQLYQTYVNDYSAYLYLTGVLGILITRVAVGYEKVILFLLNGAIAVVQIKDEDEVAKTEGESVIRGREDKKDDSQS